ncbi:hypothetical protein Taro_039355 [Colocasia esculenta]|uniref:Uncharacterized protein n=1 Tax=Colocasia esculenta TaxID=4460 RepID=A0A843WLZ6_COLES|nr:hypothetical protein [Colocasia esculenta]
MARGSNQPPTSAYRYNPMATGKGQTGRSMLELLLDLGLLSLYPSLVPLVPFIGGSTSGALPRVRLCFARVVLGLFPFLDLSGDRARTSAITSTSMGASSEVNLLEQTLARLHHQTQAGILLFLGKKATHYFNSVRPQLVTTRRKLVFPSQHGECLHSKLSLPTEEKNFFTQKQGSEVPGSSSRYTTENT